jgi:hypothetical protein
MTMFKAQVEAEQHTIRIEGEGSPGCNAVSLIIDHLGEALVWVRISEPTAKVFNRAWQAAIITAENQGGPQ